MNPKIQADWVAALRSGEYGQGTGTLRDANDNFCCLGVLCDLAIKAGVDVSVGREVVSSVYGDVEEGNYLYDEAEAFLPTVVMKWAGLDHSDPRIGPRDDSGWAASASSHNDGGASFLAIADLIEAAVHNERVEA